MKTQVELRKERRKEQRSKKRQPKRPVVEEHNPNEISPQSSSNNEDIKPKDRKRKSTEKNDSLPSEDKKAKRSKRNKDDPYAHLDPASADALRREDEEIAALQKKLGLTDRKGKDRLQKEFADQEGYGDDFVNFLDDIDGMIERVTRPSGAALQSSDVESLSEKELDEDEADSDETGDEKEDDETEDEIEDVSKTSKSKKTIVEKRKGDPLYSKLDENIAAALRKDDEEIEALEAKLGLKSKKDKKKLNKEYAKEEGYGDDFGDFLFDLDKLVSRVTGDDDRSSDESNENEDSDSSSAGEAVPGMDQGSESESNSIEEEAPHLEDEDESVDSQSTSSQDEESSSENEDDHDVEYTYKPSDGEDIYGKKVKSRSSDSAPQKYVPPHLRQLESSQDDANEQKRQEDLKVIQRSLNHVLNKLSGDSVVSVAQAIARLYPSFPTSDVNDCIWTNAKSACISKVHLMVGLIPEYVATLAGVQAMKGDSSQLAAFLMEKVVTELWKEVKISRESTETASFGLDGDLLAKQGANMTIFLCYMYNFGIIHCSLVYDIVRDFLRSFKEIDIELLLLILRHSGRALRSDDPSALKDIVLLVQKRALETAASSKNASRIDYMVTAIMDLKNNKKRNQQEIALVDKTTRLKKVIGQIKSNANGNAFPSGSALLRVSLDDILNVETKGRYWKVGASWAGNQFSFTEGQAGEDEGEKRNQGSKVENTFQSEEEAKLLKLAEKYRMNSDVRRSIFCIIMGSADCDDSFEKLIRSNLLKNKTERETVRVLLECCGREKAFNKYYSHLAARICEFQMQCKFSFQLAFWDAFKTFDDMDARKAANLAKLLFHLVVTHRCLRLNVLKAIDMASPEELSETTTIFLVIFFSDIMEYYENASEIVDLFENGIGKNKSAKVTDDEMGHMDEVAALRASFTVFFVQVLKASPKNQKASRFRTNLKAAIKACDTENFY